jgi:uncharacterized membrane protein (UPF0127 family)
MLNILRKNKIIVLLIVLPFAVTLLLTISNQLFSNNELETESKDIKACFKSNCFDIEVADTPEERETGLMFREQLASNSGMLFIFEKEDVYDFWMKNTLIPLDIIWIDENKKIIFIKENAEPCKTEKCELFGPNEKAKYVLEINEGLTEEIGLKVGNKVEYK